MPCQTDPRCEQTRDQIASVPFNAQCGASLIEVLVALLIFSFGLLGLAATQASALRYQQDAWARGAAVGLATDIAERIRANRVAARAGDYAYAVGYRAASRAGGIDPEDACSGTPQQVATCDLTAWAAAAKRRMPGGAANLAGDARQGFVATLMWLAHDGARQSGATNDDAAAGAPAASCAPDAPPGVRCLTLRFLP